MSAIPPLAGALAKGYVGRGGAPRPASPHEDRVLCARCALGDAPAEALGLDADEAGVEAARSHERGVRAPLGHAAVAEHHDGALNEIARTNPAAPGGSSTRGRRGCCSAPSSAPRSRPCPRTAGRGSGSSPPCSSRTHVGAMARARRRWHRSPAWELPGSKASSSRRPQAHPVIGTPRMPRRATLCSPYRTSPSPQAQPATRTARSRGRRRTPTAASNRCRRAP